MESAALASFLRTARWPVLTESQPTFFSVAGIAHKELPLSNVYAFFLDSEQPHGLGSLLLEALLDLVRGKAPDQVADWPAPEGPVRVAREYVVAGQQRLDLLVHDGPDAATPHGARYAVLLENKVNHWLANDLTHYWDQVPEPGRKVGLVLGVRREQPVPPWLFISHAEVAAAVQRRLGPQLHRVHPRYLPVLLHFLEHLTSMSENYDNFRLAFDFAMRHRQELARAQQLLDQLTGQGLGAAVAEAFGDDYELRAWFSDRVDIQLTQPAPLQYVVFFGHVLDLTQPPGFTVTLYDPAADKTRAAVWRAHLLNQPQVPVGAGRLPWFSYDGLLIGKEYPLANGSLTELQQAVRAALQAEWQPLQATWHLLQEPPDSTSLGTSTQPLV